MEPHKKAMTTTPDRLIEAPDRSSGPHGTDLLSDVLSRIRLSGAVFLRGEYSAPWTFDSPESRDLVDLLAPGAQRLILFHIVREGAAWVGARGERIDLEPGDLAVLPHADRHLMGSRPDKAEPIPIADLLPPPPWQGVPVCRFEGGGQTTGVVCGYLKCDELLFNSFMRRLPPVFRVRPPAGPIADMIKACINYALDERSHPRSGSAPLTTRMPELLLIEALRLYSERRRERHRLARRHQRSGRWTGLGAAPRRAGPAVDRRGTRRLRGGVAIGARRAVSQASGPTADPLPGRVAHATCRGPDEGYTGEACRHRRHRRLRLGGSVQPCLPALSRDLSRPMAKQASVAGVI
ncbi:MAG: cupin domain-containing protein [Reyranella sp.]|nr:cupin domain-containing protein [Reyranella sp.]